MKFSRLINVTSMSSRRAIFCRNTLLRWPSEAAAGYHNSGFHFDVLLCELVRVIKLRIVACHFLVWTEG